MIDELIGRLNLYMPSPEQRFKTNSFASYGLLESKIKLFVKLR